MESVIEQQRKLHEERERLEDAIVKEKTLKKATVSCMPQLYCQYNTQTQSVHVHVHVHVYLQVLK